MKYQSVLLVDDDEDSNFISELVIKKSNIADKITCFKNGKDALNFVIDNVSLDPPNGEAQIPQIVFLDLHMPVMDGFDFLSKLADQVPKYSERFKIFILSSSCNPSDIARVQDYDIHAYINKPLDINKLKLLIE